MADQAAEEVRERFRRFAERECKGYSDFYYRLTHSVVQDDELVAFIAEMPDQQPNLFLAAAQYVTGPENMPETGRAMNAFVAEHREQVAALMRSRRTQTNEVGRCAPLLPAFPKGPLALVEVGASAGLCLMPEKYRYDYGQIHLGEASSPVRLHCTLNGARPPRLELPEIVWRRGLDVAPVDLNDDSAVRWLLACVWPDHDERRRRLQAAIRFCKNHAPPVRHGDLVDDLPELLADAPLSATLVVFHSAVLPYVSAERRQAFIEVLLRFSEQRKVLWISNEAPGVLPEVDALAPQVPRLRFLIGRSTLRNGRRHIQLLAHAHAHGADLEWLDSEPKRRARGPL